MRSAIIKIVKRIVTLLVLALLSSCFVSCGFWNPDPADRLGTLIERRARELKTSKDTTASFTFVPDVRRVRKSPLFTGDVVIRVVPDPSLKFADSGSVIHVSEWFWTTYHSRFVGVTKEMKITKKPHEAFRVVLQKSGDVIYWTDLR